MSIHDSDAARAKINEFIDLIDQYVSQLRDRPESTHDHTLSDQYFRVWQEKLTSIEKWIYRLQPLMEQLASRIDDVPDRPVFEKLSHGPTPWDGARSAAERLIGILDNQEAHNQIFGPQGPTLEAIGFHPWVWNAAVDLWNDGHYCEAVSSAANAIEKQARIKVGGRNLKGYTLYGELFASKDRSKHRLVFSEFDKESDNWTSAHNGARHYGMGCHLRIRNLLVHGAVDVGEQAGLEYLAALSLLARWIDSAERASIEDEPTG